MKSKLLFCLALILSGGLFGCSSAKSHSDVANPLSLPIALLNAPNIPSAPSADQVRDWSGFPADFQLQIVSQSTTNMDNESQSMFGKPIWRYVYENTNHSPVHFGIVVCQRGTLLGTNRTKMTNIVEQQVAKMRALKNPVRKDQEELQKMIQITTLPNGRKAYFSVLGFGPGGIGLFGFSYERDYDLMVIEDCDAVDDVPAEQQMKNPISPTNDLPFIFGKVETFLEAQQNVR